MYLEQLNDFNFLLKHKYDQYLLRKRDANSFKFIILLYKRSEKCIATSREIWYNLKEHDSSITSRHRCNEYIVIIKKYSFKLDICHNSNRKYIRVRSKILER